MGIQIGTPAIEIKLRTLKMPLAFKRPLNAFLQRWSEKIRFTLQPEIRSQPPLLPCSQRKNKENYIISVSRNRKSGKRGQQPLRDDERNKVSLATGPHSCF